VPSPVTGASSDTRPGDSVLWRGTDVFEAEARRRRAPSKAAPSNRRRRGSRREKGGGEKSNGPVAASAGDARSAGSARSTSREPGPVPPRRDSPHGDELALTFAVCRHCPNGRIVREVWMRSSRARAARGVGARAGAGHRRVSRSSACGACSRRRWPSKTTSALLCREIDSLSWSLAST